MTRVSGRVGVVRGGAVRRGLEQQLAAGLVLGLTALEIAHPTSVRETVEIAAASLGAWAAGRTIGHARERVADDAFVGRQDELGVLLAGLEDARRGQPRFLLVDGPAGIGKTALLDRFQAELEGARVLRATADPSEERVAVRRRRPAAAARRRPRPGRARRGRRRARRGRARACSSCSASCRTPRPSRRRRRRALGRRRLAARAAVRRAAPDRGAVLVRWSCAARTRRGCRRGRAGSSTARGTHLRVGPLAADELQALGADGGASCRRGARRLHEHDRRATRSTPARCSTSCPSEPGRASNARCRTALVRRLVRAASPRARRRRGACSRPSRCSARGCSLAGAAPLAGSTARSTRSRRRCAAGLLRAGRGRRRERRLVRASARSRAPSTTSSARRGARGCTPPPPISSTTRSRRSAHRIAAVAGADPALATEIDAVAAREGARGAWASAALQLVAASRLSAAAATASGGCSRRPTRWRRRAGRTRRARSRTSSPPRRRPLADAVGGHLAVVGHRPEAEALLRGAWKRLRAARATPGLRARGAEHRALRARSGSAAATPSAGAAARSSSLRRPRAARTPRTRSALAYSGRLAEAEALADAAGAHRATSPCRRRGACCGSSTTTRSARAPTSPTRRRGRSAAARSTRAALGFAHLARADFAHRRLGRRRPPRGARARHGRRARPPLDPRVTPTRAAMLVPAARGDWAAAHEHAVALAAHVTVFEEYDGARRGARARAARGRTQRARGRARGRSSRSARSASATGSTSRASGRGPHLLGDALVGLGRLDEADALLRTHEALAADRGRRSAIARLGRVRGPARGRARERRRSDGRLPHGARHARGLPLPYERALVELRARRVPPPARPAARRSRAPRLGARRPRGARSRAALERCERELVACGLTPVKRNAAASATRLTPQEGAVARLVGAG